MHTTDARWSLDALRPSAAERRLAERIGDLAAAALSAEVLLTPKPGLVDRRNNGAHRDMNLDTFFASIHAIGGYFEQFALTGLRNAAEPTGRVLPLLRPVGVLAEAAMCRATGNVNTHKGGIFAMGLLCAAAGRLCAQGITPDAPALCAEVACICAGLVTAELGAATREARTAGERFYARYGMTGARGEAESGFATARLYALPVYQSLCDRGVEADRALLQAMLHLLANNDDTNLVSRGGPEGLAFVQHQARALIARGGVLAQDGLDQLAALDDALIARHLSPGGSADLIAVTVFLAEAPVTLGSQPIDQLA
ncbi:MAG: triphosphoribosyl-dephospho-CoA synthase CitG [Paludibacterium sp.]|uniref:triphosphoribosyl-dephospho-CoA synthase CitG n=1 Tax=Paludibacterium sp. TaxID=1917523 RepID=UPI0025E6EC42|nr:triphosphoribosyl-dephospho-CoA synthase CitG [Paludibacterium sp.]MBV8045698.1 triphosphoribosyl-dephospho-CoA synthase CitG [Paludibacterium sp.]MBV8649464.1 triphosphoribosyl-dephospho-CoA synthase CitG [Paludibacterium sp.]